MYFKKIKRKINKGEKKKKRKKRVKIITAYTPLPFKLVFQKRKFLYTLNYHCFKHQRIRSQGIHQDVGYLQLLISVGPLKCLNCSKETLDDTGFVSGIGLG